MQCSDRCWIGLCWDYIVSSVGWPLHRPTYPHELLCSGPWDRAAASGLPLILTHGERRGTQLSATGMILALFCVECGPCGAHDMINQLHCTFKGSHQVGTGYYNTSPCSLSDSRCR
jgi:hypothetical protein